MTPKEIRDKINAINGEVAEKEILNGVKDYFKNNPNEDALILCNQDLHDIR